MYRLVLKWFQKVRVKDTFDGIPGNFKFHSQSATWEVFHVINYANIFSNNLQNFHLVCALSQNGRTFNVENIFIYQIVAHVLAIYTDPRLPSYSTCISSERKKNLRRWYDTSKCTWSSMQTALAHSRKFSSHFLRLYFYALLKISSLIFYTWIYKMEKTFCT